MANFISFSGSSWLNSEPRIAAYAGSPSRREYTAVPILTSRSRPALRNVNRTEFDDRPKTAENAIKPRTALAARSREVIRARDCIILEFRGFSQRLLETRMKTTRKTPGRTIAHQPVLLVNIGQLLTLRSQSESVNSGPRRGRALSELGIIHDGAVLCVGGKITAIGRTAEALRDAWVRKNRKTILEIDCAKKVAMPGFV